MPKGRMSIWGSGPYRRVSLPKDGMVPKSKEQQRLVELNDLSQELLGELSDRTQLPLSTDGVNAIWAQVLEAVGIYLGQSKSGLPPTNAQLRKALADVAKSASHLDELLTSLDFHTYDRVQKLVLRRGGDVSTLKKELASLLDIDVEAKSMKTPKGRPNPYKEFLIRDLYRIWTDAIGTRPGKITGPANALALFTDGATASLKLA